MRILAGQYKGRLLTMPRGIRPTQGKVRKAILDTLGERIVGARCLDLYAGSGAVGFEMLSWGAAHVTFVESHSAVLRVLEENVRRLEGGSPSSLRSAGCGSGGQGRFLPVRIARGEAAEEIPRLEAAGEWFDVIFIDPPYSQGLIADCLQTLDHHVILAADFHLIVQGFWKDRFPEDFRRFRQQKLVRYGDTAVAWYGPA